MSLKTYIQYIHHLIGHFEHVTILIMIGQHTACDHADSPETIVTVWRQFLKEHVNGCSEHEQSEQVDTRWLNSDQLATEWWPGKTVAFCLHMKGVLPFAQFSSADNTHFTGFLQHASPLSAVLVLVCIVQLTVPAASQLQHYTAKQPS